MFLLLGITGVAIFSLMFSLGVIRLHHIYVLSQRRRLTAAVADLQIECQQFISLLSRCRVATSSQLGRELLRLCPLLTASQVITISEWAFVFRYCTRTLSQSDSIYYISAAGKEWLRQSTSVSGSSSA